MKRENVWWLTCPVAIILFTLTAFNQFCRTLHLVINGDRHTNCFPSVENNRRLHLKLHLLYCSLRRHHILCVKRLSWIGEPQPFQAKEGYVEYQRVNWRPNVHPMIRHILFVTYCIFISWGTNEKRGWDMIEDLLWGLATSFQTSLEAFSLVSHTLAQRIRIKNVKGRADIRPSMRRCFFGNFWRALHSSGVQQFSKNQKLLSGGLSFQTIESIFTAKPAFEVDL